MAHNTGFEEGVYTEVAVLLGCTPQAVRYGIIKYIPKYIDACIEWDTIKKTEKEEAKHKLLTYPKKATA